MASVNKVILLGHLTRDPETKTFANGGKVAKIGIAVDGERKKDQTTGKWQSTPCYLDCKAFNSQTGRKTADVCEQYLSKGQLVHIIGHLVTESWEDKQTGAKRSKLVVMIDELTLMPKQGVSRTNEGRQPAPRETQQESYEEEPQRAPDDSEIPF